MSAVLLVHELLGLNTVVGVPVDFSDVNGRILFHGRKPTTKLSIGDSGFSHVLQDC